MNTERPCIAQYKHKPHTWYRETDSGLEAVEYPGK